MDNVSDYGAEDCKFDSWQDPWLKDLFSVVIILNYEISSSFLKVI